MESRCCVALLVLSLAFALPAGATAQDLYKNLNRTGTGSGTGPGAPDQGTIQTGMGTVQAEPAKWDGPRYSKYSPQMRGLLDQMIDYYRQYQGAPADTEQEERSRQRFEDTRTELTAMRARGSVMYPHQTPALRACLQAYRNYREAAPDSVLEKVAKFRYEESLKDAELLGQLQAYCLPQLTAFERYLEHYGSWQEAPAGAVEAFHKRASELYLAQLERHWGWGRTLSRGCDDASESYLQALRAAERPDTGAVPAVVARKRADLYLRELQMLGCPDASGYAGSVGSGGVSTSAAGHGHREGPREILGFGSARETGPTSGTGR